MRIRIRGRPGVGLERQELRAGMYKYAKRLAVYKEGPRETARRYLNSAASTE